MNALCFDRFVRTQRPVSIVRFWRQVDGAQRLLLAQTGHRFYDRFAQDLAIAALRPSDLNIGSCHRALGCWVVRRRDRLSSHLPLLDECDRLTCTRRG